MKTVTNKPCFQGDLMIRRIDDIPAGVVASNPENGVHILAHSETGHHHVVLERSAQKFIDQTNAFISYLSVADTSVIEHLRSHDTHEALEVPPGNYEIRNQREYIPEGFRRAAD